MSDRSMAIASILVSLLTMALMVVNYRLIG